LITAKKISFLSLLTFVGGSAVSIYAFRHWHVLPAEMRGEFARNTRSIYLLLFIVSYWLLTIAYVKKEDTIVSFAMKIIAFDVVFLAVYNVYDCYSGSWGTISASEHLFLTVVIVVNTIRISLYKYHTKDLYEGFKKKIREMIK